MENHETPARQSPTPASAPSPTTAPASIRLSAGAKLAVLGGMGPLASADFLTKLIAATPAVLDADHIPVILWSVPQIPDRLASMEGRGESPVPKMVEALRAMAACGAVQAVIACNTAHFWYDELVAGGGLPILHIADAASEAISIATRPADAASEAISLAARPAHPAREAMSLARAQPAGSEDPSARGRRIMLFATRGTHAAGFYAPRLARHGHEVLPMDEGLQKTFIEPAIEAVKSNRLDAAGRLMAEALAAVEGPGIDIVLLGCTELPLAYASCAARSPLTVIDATAALASACVRAWNATGNHPPERIQGAQHR